MGSQSLGWAEGRTAGRRLNIESKVESSEQDRVEVREGRSSGQCSGKGSADRDTGAFPFKAALPLDV